MFIPVILSGGMGTRLWPSSRADSPKPLIPLPDGETLLQKTFQRLLSLDGVGPILVVTHIDYQGSTEAAFRSVAGNHDAPHFILEPFGRNTAPALAMAALYLSEHMDAQTPILAVPADHIVSEQATFGLAVEAALELARQGWIAAFGIPPQHPETGYGYIEQGREIPNILPDTPNRNDPKVSIFAATRFIEKPEITHAEGFVQSGKHLWNSGMYAFTAETILNAIKQSAPEVMSCIHTCWAQSKKSKGRLLVSADSFQHAPDISIDYAVMEKADNVAVIQAELGWDDVGSWDAYSRFLPEDDSGNRSEGEVLIIDSEHSFIHSEGRLVAVLGMRDTFVIDSPDALLVVNREHLQDIKKLVQKLNQSNHPSCRSHPHVQRPWGTYTLIDQGPGYQAKRIVVNPEGSLSLQLHHKRSETWIVVRGTATVILGEKEHLLKPNDILHIPANTRHRVTNKGSEPLIIIEVATGDYLGEDDIIRFQDIYGRTTSDPESPA